MSAITPSVQVAARELAAEFAATAAERDRERRLPTAELDKLSAAGLLAITVPTEFGGPGLPPSAVAALTATLAAADASIAQIPHSHFVYLNLLRLAGSPQQQRQIFGQVLAGGRVANAQSERGGKTIADISTTITGSGDTLRLNGEKYYCTGALYADILAVLAVWDGIEVIAFLPAHTPGITIVDDWNGMGQRTTGSGTVRFTDVAVPADALAPREPAVTAPGYGAYAQLLHSAIDVGLARGALETGAEFVRTKSRPWFEANVERAIDDPLLVQRVGELTVTVRAAEAALTVAGAAVDAVVAQPDDDTAREASLAVATAKVLADRAATEVTAALFEISGTRSAAEPDNLNRFWRDARTHTLHDPVRWKYQHLGAYTLKQQDPGRHGLL